MIRSRLKSDVRISDRELELLAMVNNLGPCTSEKVHENLNHKTEYLLVMRGLHKLVEKGFLQRVLIDKKPLYRIRKNYSRIRTSR